MSADLSFSLREITALIPAKLRLRLILSSIVGFCFNALTVLFQPVITRSIGDIVSVINMKDWMWICVGIVVVYPPAFLYDRFASTTKDPAERNIDLLEKVIIRGEFGMAEKKLIWQKLAWNMVEQFNMYAGVESQEQAIKTTDGNKNMTGA